MTSSSTLTAANPFWIVSAEEAIALLDQGATLLDARSGIRLGDYLKGAAPIRWQDFSRERPDRGKLLNQNAALNQRLQALGIRIEKPTVVFSHPPHGWGEDGRIVWMLRSLGHPSAVLVDGGFRALHQAGLRKTWKPGFPDESGNFEVQRIDDYTIQRDELKARLNDPDLVLLDTRSTIEFLGATPFGETRGGHPPGALSLPFKQLMTADGYILPLQAICDRLSQVGVSPNKEIVSYCTGGIRSAWVAVVLNHAGFRARNYAGSMWEWSALPDDAYPLVRGH
jgi:thiosulfate/3-mercaptopyruvate sulfurtransferase